jgi:hypothetical protein
MTLTSIIKDDMKVDSAKKIQFGEIELTKTKPVIVKFTSFDDREKVRMSCRNLKGKEIGVSQQFPKDIQELGRDLVPEMKKLGKRAKRHTRKCGKCSFMECRRINHL